MRKMALQGSLRIQQCKEEILQGSPSKCRRSAMDVLRALMICRKGFLRCLEKTSMLLASCCRPCLKATMHFPALHSSRSWTDAGAPLKGSCALLNPTSSLEDIVGCPHMSLRRPSPMVGHA